MIFAADPLLSGGVGWPRSSDRRDQGRGRIRVPARRHDVHGVVRAQGHRGHAEPRRPEQGRTVGTAANPRRRHRSCSSKKTCFPTRPIGWCSASRRTCRCSRRSWSSRSSRSVATSPATAMAPCRYSAVERCCSSPTRRSASCSYSRSARSPSTASCSRVGRRVRSIRCSARSAPRPR